MIYNFKEKRWNLLLNLFLILAIRRHLKHICCLQHFLLICDFLYVVNLAFCIYNFNFQSVRFLSVTKTCPGDYNYEYFIVLVSTPHFLRVGNKEVNEGQEASIQCLLWGNNLTSWERWVLNHCVVYIADYWTVVWIQT